MKHNTVELKDLNDFLEAGDATFAYSSREDKRLVVFFNGLIQVRVAGKIVYEGDPSSAVEVYNSITKKHVAKKTEFRI